MGVRRNVSSEATSTFFLHFSGCWQYNANGRSQNALPFLQHEENALSYGNSHENCATLAQQCIFFTRAFVHTQYSNTCLTTISSHCLAAIPAKTSAVNSHRKTPITVSWNKIFEDSLQCFCCALKINSRTIRSHVSQCGGR